jgi:hypothetical protein
VKLLYKTILALAILAPSKILACAACYANGANINDPMVDGMNWAILTLGVVIATVLGTFLTFLIYAIRKSEALEAAAQKNSRESLSKFGGRRDDQAQTGGNMEPPHAGYGIQIGSPEPSKA